MVALVTVHSAGAGGGDLFSDVEGRGDGVDEGDGGLDGHGVVAEVVSSSVGEREGLGLGVRHPGGFFAAGAEDGLSLSGVGGAELATIDRLVGVGLVATLGGVLVLAGDADADVSLGVGPVVVAIAVGIFGRKAVAGFGGLVAALPLGSVRGRDGGATGESTGIISTLALIHEDINKDIAKATAEEAKAIADFTEFKSDSEKTIQDLNTIIGTLDGEKA